MENKGILKPRPHARIITMIGDQLIRNEKVALMELLKNSYDADASWVQIRFINFDTKDNELKSNQKSVIEIEDDGLGMSFEIIEKSWINPASPYKYLLKKKGKETTKKGRIIQGEKGIGRFAVFKLGSTIEIITRSFQKDSKEICLKSDLSMYDSELIGPKDSKKEEPFFIDEIEYNYEIRTAKELKERVIKILNKKLKRPPCGTLIRVTNLTGHWTLDKIKQIFKDSLKLMSPFNKVDFTCHITLNGETIFSAFEKDELADILSMAPIHMEGSINEKGNTSYTLSKQKKQYKVALKDLASDSEVREQFYDKSQNTFRIPECGSFNFRFYVFDLDRKASLESPLDSNAIKIIKNHRIYLYRDGVRVYPYGDPSDDWIELDIKRGTKRAGAYLSNDQVIGYVAISSKDNPALRDKTNREGLMDIGYAYEDLRILILGILGLLKNAFQKYKDNKKIGAEQSAKKEGFFQEEPKVHEDIQMLQKHLTSQNDKKGTKLIQQLDRNYKKEKDILNERVEIVEDLAAVGISVDAASHDLVIMIKRAKETLSLLFEMTKNDNGDFISVQEVLEKLRGQFAFIEDQLHGIQPLFRSSRRRSKDIRITEIIDKVKKYYSVPINDRKIKISVKEKGPPLVVNCSEGILLQAFINLFDNSVYWLTTSEDNKKEIKIVLDGNKSEAIFADNGPGVKKDDFEFIFKPFFTTKGIKGRGLGLYITRQLLERYDYEINYIDKQKNKVLKGANFAVSFFDEELE